ncbi:MAG: 3'-5' exonuclease [Caulobacter sp.]|nr:3'-5' exonuclease [Caulobacter sp.]
MSNDLDLERYRAALEASGEYRVLRKLKAPAVGEATAETRMGLFLDVETTGLDPRQDEIIELAMVPFFYLPDGRIVGTGEPFDRLRQPSQPISAEITALTGIDDAMVADQVIDRDEVAAFAAPAALIVAHNAAFDRRFAERFSPVFTTKPWACSMAEVPWTEEGSEGVKLAYLAMGQGFFYDRHRALNDCYAAIELLSRPLPRSGEVAFSKLLASARRPLWRIWAENSPFDLKDRLKARGYRWNGDPGPAPRAWFVDVPEEQLQEELTFLQTEIYLQDVDLLRRRISAYDRYSDRC